MIYGSVCSGIEAASVAWHPLGWRAAFFSEVEAFPRAVLAERWPGVPIHGDFTTIKEGDYEPIELLVGGTPCQDFSVAGLRAGLAGDRGALTIEFVRLSERLRPRWLVWENVPGVLSSDGGRAFGLFLGALGECGYGTAWRVLDAQYFGVPQRRRRVFVVGYLGDWRPAAAVLFEPESLRGDPAPRRATGKGVARELAPCIGASGRGFEQTGDPRGQDCLIAFGANNTAGPIDVATACNAHGGPHGRLDFETETFVTHAPEVANCLSPGTGGGGGHNYRQASGSDQVIVTHSLRAEGFDAGADGTGRGTPLVAVDCYNGAIDGDVTHSTRAGNGNALGGVPAVMTLAIRGRGGSHDLEYRDDGIANAILTPNGGRAGIGVGAVAVHAFDAPPEAGNDTCLPYLAAADDPENLQALRPLAGGSRGHRLPVPAEFSKGHTIAVAFNPGEITRPRSANPPPDGLCPPLLGSEGYDLAVAYSTKLHNTKSNQSLRDALHAGEAGATAPLDRRSGVMSVRRLTPRQRECERLQGFPDGYTLVTYRGKPAAGGPRYRALGNSMAVPCMFWLGERIEMVEKLINEGE